MVTYSDNLLNCWKLSLGYWYEVNAEFGHSAVKI